MRPAHRLVLDLNVTIERALRPAYRNFRRCLPWSPHEGDEVPSVRTAEDLQAPGQELESRIGLELELGYLFDRLGWFDRLGLVLLDRRCRSPVSRAMPAG